MNKSNLENLIYQYTFNASDNYFYSDNSLFKVGDGYFARSKYKEKEDSYDIFQVIVGFAKKDISVKCSERELKIFLNFSENKREQITHMRFCREVVPSEIKAKLQNGVLTISVPKKNSSASFDVHID
jgi:HSP20 family molecular chaperone IbpA